MRPPERPPAPKKACPPDPVLWVRTPPRVEPLDFRRAPVLFAALCFCLGAASTRLVYQPPIVWLPAFTLLAFLTLLCLRRSPWLPLLPLAALWLTLGLAATELQPAPSPQTALHPYTDGLLRTVRGRIARIRTLLPRPPEDPDTDGYPTASDEADPPSDLSFDLTLEAIEDVTPDTTRMVPITGGIRATLLAAPDLPTLHCGDILEAPMRLRTPDRFRDPGAWQYADYLLAQGIAAQATLHNTLTLTPNDHATLQCRLFAAQTWASARLARYSRSTANHSLPPVLRLTPTDAAMLDAMLFGDRTALTHTLRLGFERTGSFHLFVVSGIHVGLIAWGLFALARRLRLSLAAATFTTIALTAAYAALTGFAIPAQRALFMASIFLIARLLDRSRNTLNALGLAILGVLVWSPSSLFEASFQMSFLAIVAVAGIAIPLGERTFLPYLHATRHLPDTWRDVAFPPLQAQFRVLLRMAGESTARIAPRTRALPATLLRAILWAAELILVALVAEAVMVLPMAVYFHRATLFSLPANVFTIPILALLVPSALLTFAATLLGPWAALLPAAITAVLLHGITTTIAHISSIQLADLRTPGPALPIAFAALAAFALCCWAVRTGRLPRVVALALVAVVLPATAVLVLWPEPILRTPGQLELTALDVGQGDSLLVVSPTGRTLLVDAGGPIGSHGNTASQATAFDLGEEVVAPYLWSRRIRRLDALALTHEHSDHMGGVPAILRALRPRELWLGVDAPSVAYTAVLAEAATLNIPIRHLRAGDTIPWDPVQITVLAPEPTYRPLGAPRNDDSLVLYLQFGAASLLLAGDAEAPEERAMLAHNRLASVTLLKVGHHGSITSTTPAFLAALAPHGAVISVGRQNPFGHPRSEIVARLAERHTTLYRTDLHGLTTFLLSPEGTIRTVPPPY